MVKYAIIVVSILIGLVRVTPGFPAHGLSWEGSYEAAVHTLMGMMLAGPVVFWIVRRIAQKAMVDPSATKVDDSYRNGLIDASRSLRAVFDAWKPVASWSFWCAIVLTFGVEGVMFTIR